MLNNSLKILHLEDVKSDAELVARELKKGNIEFEIKVVENKADFEKALKEFSPDIILSDHSLPTFNSVEALMIVKDAGENIPFILVTATVSEEFAIEMMKEGVYDYILKDRLQRLPTAILNATEKRKAEKERQNYLDQVVDNEALMREAEQLAHFGSWQIDLLTGKAKWSDEAYRIHGYQPWEVQPTLESFINYVHPEDIDFVRRVFNEGIKNLPSIKLSYRIKDKNGKIKFIQAELIVERNHGKEPIRITGFILDVTKLQHEAEKKRNIELELQSAYEDIRSMNIELENKVEVRTLILQEALQELERSQTELNEALSKEKELNEIKSRFVSMASHEFRTPLSTVLSSASLIAKYHETGEQNQREKHIRRIKDSVKHLNDMLEDFLNLGKLEEGKVSTQVMLFNVKEFLHDVFDEMKSTLKIGQQMKLQFEGKVDFVTDKRLLKNILINLFSNAIKFSTEHQIIQIDIINSGERLIIQVKDEGIGIAKEDMQHLFSTFYRGKNAINIQGTGLGLHIVKRYIDMLEGQITLSSELYKGSTVNIGIPNLKQLISIIPNI